MHQRITSISAQPKIFVEEFFTVCRHIHLPELAKSLLKTQ